MLKYGGYTIFMLLLFSHFVWSQPEVSEIKINLEQDTLTLENDKIKATYLWNNGNVALQHLKNKSAHKSITFSASKENFHLNGESSKITNSNLEITENTTKNYKEAVITFNIDKIKIKHIIRLYDGVQGISNTYFLKGKTQQNSWNISKNKNLEMIETQQNKDEELSRIGQLDFNARHWKFRSVQFFEATDHHDNPVKETSFLSHRKQRQVAGNLLFVSDSKSHQSLFVLKESPIGESQQYYPGFDFLIDYNGVSIHGIGVSPADLHTDWVRGYGYAIGISKQDEMFQKKAVLTYQKKVNPYQFERDFMIMSNTWGDRSKDSRMNETFILKEIEAASKLGITHFQLDDGWQQGLSRNSASKAGMKWDDWSKEDWNPHKSDFLMVWKKS